VRLRLDPVPIYIFEGLEAVQLNPAESIVFSIHPPETRGSLDQLLDKIEVRAHYVVWEWRPPSLTQPGGIWDTPYTATSASPIPVARQDAEIRILSRREYFNISEYRGRREYDVSTPTSVPPQIIHNEIVGGTGLYNSQYWMGITTGARSDTLGWDRELVLSYRDGRPSDWSRNPVNGRTYISTALRARALGWNGAWVRTNYPAWSDRNFPESDVAPNRRPGIEFRISDPYGQLPPVIED